MHLRMKVQQRGTKMVMLQLVSIYVDGFNAFKLKTARLRMC